MPRLQEWPGKGEARQEERAPEDKGGLWGWWQEADGGALCAFCLLQQMGSHMAAQSEVAGI